MATVAERRGIVRRPMSNRGVWSWVTTIDHKKIGILYGATALFFLGFGGIEAMVIRIQLARPGAGVVSEATYNQIFTMHGLTMVFLVVMPLGAAFANYFIPLMIGARDVAFPRINAFSYWAFLFGGTFLYSSFMLGGAPDGGWFGYPPNSVVAPGNGMTYYALGLAMLGIASTASAVNLAVTVIQLRAPGMTLMRMPVFVWMVLVVQFLLIFSLPIITLGLVQLLFDRRFGTLFYDPGAGGDPVLWQHLFWLFGHPEVYILILPAFGIVSEILPVFARKPLFGRPFVIFSGIAIGFLGFGVWAHHMFTVGLGPVANSAFGVATMLIAIPTGVKIFNWLGTLWKGDIRFDTPLLYAVGFVALFIVGGLSGVMHAVVPSDYQQTDTYFVVAHFHYVLFGGALFGFIGGLHYWFPKVFGRMMGERLGKAQFWVMFIGMNLTFWPMHALGLQGMPRRIYTYEEGMGWDLNNLIASVGAAVLAVAILMLLANIILSLRKPKDAPADPWDGRTLEWSVSSPPPEYNFAEIPVVHHEDDLWHHKYTQTREGTLVPVQAGAAEADAGEVHVHMPSPSFWPLITALGLPIIGYGLLYNWIAVGVGAVVTAVGLFGWVLEPSAEEE
jgi:cytochrome c oxidase subunit I